jgi:hypothetical protein
MTQRKKGRGSSVKAHKSGQTTSKGEEKGTGLRATKGWICPGEALF